MGFFSKLGGAFHAAGEGPNESGLEKYGAPARSLYTELKLGDLHQKVEVKDEQGKVLYWTKSAIIAIKGKTDIFDASDALVAHLEKKPISMHEEHYITMADGTQITLSNRLFQVFKDVTDIKGLDWKLQGNVIGLNFMLFDQNGEPVAAIGQKALSIHNRFSIDLYQPQHEKTVVAIVISLQKMLAARRENADA
jgi:uncharacterized protein YxjI